MQDKKELCLTDLAVIKGVMARHGAVFKKGLGQNFLTDPTVCPRMAEAISGENTAALEIGAGVGVLTRELLARCNKVVCVELDEKLFPVLEETLPNRENLTLVCGDILKTDLHALIKEHFEGMELFVCANLPYYITSPVIMKLLEENLPIQKIIVMVQKEAADRLCAEVGSRNGGAVTVAVSYRARAQKLFDVPRTSFYPQPKVDSCVIELDLTKRQDYGVKNEELFFSVVRGAFSQRRKTVLNSLSSYFGIGKTELESALSSAGVSPTLRAEALTMENFASITDEISKLRKDIK